MVRIKSLFTFTAAYLASSISAQSILCQYFGLSPLQCAICGYTPSAPVYCVAYNGTFDDLPSGSLQGVYKNTAWPGFSVLPQAQAVTTHSPQHRPSTTGSDRPTKRSENTNGDVRLTHKAGIRSLIKKAVDSAVIPTRKLTVPIVNSITLSPASAPNYAMIPAGTSGTMVFGKEGGVDPIATNGQYPAGTLHYFSYACAVPGTNPPIAAACSITISGHCLPKGGYDFVNGPFANFSTSISYDPALLVPGSLTNMQELKIDFSQNGYDQGIALPQKCSNYTFSATPIIGALGAVPLTSVELLLDNIIYNTFSIGYT